MDIMALSKVIAKCPKNANNTVSVYSFNTPVGKICGAADDDFLYIVVFEDSKNFEKSLQKLAAGFVVNKNIILKQLEVQLQEYFEGQRMKFTLPLKTFGSDFQQSVWDKLQAMPYGSTQTYGDIAKALGRQASHSRAIGAACGANPHVIVIPCHRVVATGSKGGFSCGVDRKEWLIEHEKKFA